MSRVGVGGHWQLRFAFADPSVVTSSHAAGVASTGVTAGGRLHVHEPPAPLPGEYRPTPAKQTRVRHPRTSSILPAPKPLAEAIAAGHFGNDEDGMPIRPSRDEVREITASHAETLKDAVQGRRHDELECGITRYAETFGPEAAERLRSYVHHLAHESVGPTWRR